MNLSPLGNYLHAERLGQMGKSLFEVEMPATCTRGILLMDAYHGTPRDPYLPGYHITEFRVIVRAVDQADGRALAEAVNQALDFKQERVLDDILVKQMYPMMEPKVYRRSAAGYWEFETDVSITFVRL